MITYQRFHYNWMTWRRSDLAKVRDLSDLTELPPGVIVHILDNFVMDGKISYGPRTDNHLINMNKFRLFMHNVTTWPTKKATDVAPINKEKMILFGGGVISNLSKYRISMQPRVLFYDDYTRMPERLSTMNIVNWNPMFRIRCLGVRRKIRFFNFLYSCIINKIMEAPDRMHFIHIPLENQCYQRQHFLRIFRKFDRIAALFPERSTYLFLAHLYALIAKPMTLPKRNVKMDDEEAHEKVGEEGLSPITKFEVDEDLTGLQSRELLNMIKCYSEEMGASQEELDEFPYKNSIFEYIPPRMFEKINFILTAGDKYVCFNLRDFKELNGSANAGLLKIIGLINTLVREGYSNDVTDDEPVPDVPEVPEAVSSIDENGSNAPTFTKPRTLEERKEAAEQDVTELDDIEPILEKNPDMTVSQKEHVKKLSKAYKEVKIDGVKIEELLTKIPDDEIKPDTVKTTATDTGAITEESTQSSISKASKTYIDTLMKQDIASIATSFNKQGMFLTGVDQEEIVDDLNRLTLYTAHFEDLQHKKHQVKIPVPKPDDKGRIKVNGVTKMMRMQRVNKPIVKVSPTRVTLNTNYNKALIERNAYAAHDFLGWFTKKGMFKAAKEGGITWKPHTGICRYPIKAFPFELTELGRKFHGLEFTAPDHTVGELWFDIMNRASRYPDATVNKRVTTHEQETASYWFGHRTSHDVRIDFFMSVDGSISGVNLATGEEVFCGAFGDLFEWITGVFLIQSVEYIEMTYLSKTFPLIHPLAYRFGLTNMLRYCKCDYTLHDIKEKIETRPSDIVIRFADKRLVINRTPRHNALLFGGLTAFDLEDVYFEDMDGKDIYYQLLTQLKLTFNSIKGIDSFFDLFIDPITRDVLRDMREPTDLRDLLLRAVSLLTTSDHIDPASEANFRYRGVEQMTGIIYNEMARAYATYKNKSIGATNKFSLAEHTIKQRIIQDQLMEKVDTINPIEDIKDVSAFSGAGSGGRSSETFLIADRKFTEDSLGIVSEATVDNGKTGMVAYLPANPIMRNARGLTEKVPIDQLKPENVFSFNTLLMPCVTQDDGKRDSDKFKRLQGAIPVE